MPIVRLSAWCALRCKEELFQRFLGVQGEQAAIETVRTKCGLKSRAEIDTDLQARARFDEIIRFPFIDYSNRKG